MRRHSEPSFFRSTKPLDHLSSPSAPVYGEAAFELKTLQTGVYS